MTKPHNKLLTKENKNLLAILGPTNTGKTYLAFDRLISYKSGIFGFPLRLLARENYDKAVKILGSQKVALVTGEEKILPKEAKYFFCTVESMPLNIEVECVAIDEVQLASDYERGHIFTDRILNLRGVYETIFLGSSTIENILVKLFPKIDIQKRDRFSSLSYLQKKSLSKLNPRSAVIAFNINSVYEIAESLRTHKGGAAVVLGSLSPRTRNAQVEVYEDKKVDYIVATDAIGMGLNLNINHVSFSSLQKFDGRYTRDLSVAELSQIAGRAGRYLSDGTFGYLKNAGSLDQMIINCIEEHKFDNIQKIYWRNSNIEFQSIESVLNSFKKFPTKNIFIHKKNAEDEVNFRSLIQDKKILFYLKDYQSISLLWDVCRIPDFQKIFNDSYIELLKNIYLTLIQNEGALPNEWLKEKILRLENYKGGIEELSIKIATIRTWTYIANQSSWIKEYEYWQNKTYEIENNLSDLLHISLTNRFVDFSASYFVDNKNRGEEAIVKVDSKKKIKLNGQNYGYIHGFDLELEISKSESLFSLSNVKRSIRSMIQEKINNFLNAPEDSLNFGDINKGNFKEDVKVFWGDEAVAKLNKGKNILSPLVETYNTEFLESDKKILVTKKIQKWLDNTIKNTLNPIVENIDEEINSEVRAIIYNVYQELGTMQIGDYLKVIKSMTPKDKLNISKSGIRIGAKFFFMPNLLKKFPMELNILLWKIFNDFRENLKYPFPKDGRVSFSNNINLPDSYWSAIGYKNINNLAIRVDVFERIFYLARQKIKYGPFLESSDLMNPIGCNSAQLKEIMKFCDFDSVSINQDKILFYNKVKKQDLLKDKLVKKVNNAKNKIIKLKNSTNPAKSKKKIINKNAKSLKTEKVSDPNSPFAVLEKLL